MIPETLRNAFDEVKSHGRRGFCVAHGALIFNMVVVVLWYLSLSNFTSYMSTWSDAWFVNIQSLSSLCEISIGVNIALSLVDSMTGYIVAQQSSYVAQYDMKKNATFAEAFTEVTSSLSKSGMGITPEKFTDVFGAQLTKEFAEFVNACGALTTMVKAMGGAVALEFFILLCVATLMPGNKVHVFVVLLTFGLAILPLALHVLGTWLFSRKFVRDVELFRNGQSEMPVFATLSQQILTTYRSKRKNLSAPDTAMETARGTVARESGTR